MGHRTRKGAKWSDTTIERLIRDTTAIGKKRANYSTQSNAVTGAWELKPKADWVFHDVEPLVPEELFNECVSYLDSQRLKGKRYTRQSVNLFMGYAHCGCGTKMMVPSQSKKYVCQSCKNRIPMDTLEECFLVEIAAAGITGHDVDLRKKRATQKINELSLLIDTHKETIRKVDGDIDTLLDLYQKQALDEAGFKSRYDEKAERKAELEEELPRLLARQEAIRQSVLNSESAFNETKNILERWNDLTKENKRLLIESVLVRVDISEDEVEFTFLHEPNAASSILSDQSSSSTPPNPPLYKEVAPKQHKVTGSSPRPSGREPEK